MRGYKVKHMKHVGYFYVICRLLQFTSHQPIYTMCNGIFLIMCTIHQTLPFILEFTIIIFILFFRLRQLCYAALIYKIGLDIHDPKLLFGHQWKGWSYNAFFTNRVYGIKVEIGLTVGWYALLNFVRNSHLSDKFVIELVAL